VVRQTDRHFKIGRVKIGRVSPVASFRLWAKPLTSSGTLQITRSAAVFNDLGFRRTDFKKGENWGCAKGNVDEVRVLGGNPILGEAAERAVKQWIFSPSHASSPVQVLLRFDP
jgi:hypothetical protein